MTPPPGDGDPREGYNPGNGNMGRTPMLWKHGMQEKLEWKATKKKGENRRERVPGGQSALQQKVDILPEEHRRHGGLMVGCFHVQLLALWIVCQWFVMCWSMV